MPFKFLFSTRYYSTLIIVFFLQLLSVSANAQTIGGIGVNDDFDGDGIINSIDLDDDNDGIPDTDEYCKSSILLPATNTTSTITEFRVPTGWTITNSSPDIATTASSIYNGWVGGCSGTAPAAPNGHTSWVNFYSNTQEAFKTNISGLTIGKIYILKVFYAKFAATPALGQITVKLGATVIDQYRPTLGCGWETRFITFTASATSHDLQFQNTGLASPMQNASVSVSADPLYEVCDTDNDGLPNQFDLDSDGDGCTDAKEAGVQGTLRSGDVKNGANGGVVTTTTTMTGAISGALNTYGTNGLADGIETVAESGIINYFSTYSSYALASNLNICTGVDTDGDGVTDLTDLDDDNDGIKDCEEGVIIPLDFSAPTLFTNRNIDATGIVKYTSSQLGTGGQLNGPSGDANGNISVSVNTGVDLRTSYSVAFSYPTSIIIRNNTKIIQGYLTFDEYFDFSTSTGNIIALSDPAFELQIFLNNAWVDVPANYSAAAIRWRVKEGTFQPGAGNFAFTIQNASSFTFYHYNNQNTSANATTLNISRNCIDTDTDNDGIPNRLDLDSDGDSCPDALESSVSGSFTTGTIKNGLNGNVTSTTNSVANAIAVGTYGINGLADGVESAPESGFVNYASKYAQFALSPTLANCKDSDGDGIVDLLDIDDDNDGVLDATESPSCFMSIDDWNTTNKSMYATITSDLTTLAGYTNFGELTDNEGTLSGTKFVTTTAQAQLNKAIFKLEFSSPTQIDALYIQKYDATQIFAATAASLKLQGSNDNTSWTDLTAALGQPANASFTTANGARAITNANKFIVTTGAGKYKYYRIYGILAANVLSGTANEFFFDINNATYQASNFTLATCTNDTDGDGKPNYLDLDSDGDGCSDALESGTTTSTTVNFNFSGTMGANGLDNSLETVADNGNINYTSTYTTYAKEILINACLDTDGDGVRNVLDIDDDNDGVLDVTEQYCATNGALTDLYGPTYWKSISWTGGAYLAQYSYATPDIYIDGILNNGVEVFRPGTVDNPIAGDDFTATPIIYTLVPQNPLHADGFSIVNDYGASGDNIVKADIKLYTGSVSSPTLMGTETIDNMLDVSSTTRYAFSKGYDNITSIKILVYKTEPAGTQAANGMQMGELGLYSNAGTYCADIDTDGDGTPNRLDLDSDGDGCSDAIESGATTNTTSNFSFIGTMGTNGLANSLETIADNGMINYVSTYSFAIANNYAACADLDQDGINDITDIDDDNDGVLDAVESPSCFFKEFEWNTDDKSSFVKVTSDLITTNTFSSQLLTDNNTSSSITFTTASAQSQIGKAIFTVNFNTPVKLDAWYILKTNATQIFATTASSLMVQGSNNNTNWTNLSAATASPANATNTTVNGSIILANSNKFTITTNAGYYKYYRIYGVGTSAANILGGSAAEFYFDFNANSYNPSQYPKLTCVNDTDGDGILNHLDLDSDGDGCPDAKEAGLTAALTSGIVTNLISGVVTTTANVSSAVVSGTFGANGFADALETATESGVYSGMYTIEYVTNKNLNACLDSDGDGINDVFDLDDDNDGILDTQEQISCYTYGVNLDNITFNGIAVTSKTSNSITTSTPAWISSYSTENFSLPLSLKFNRLSTDGTAMFGLIPAANTQTPSNYNDLGYKFNIALGQAYGYFNGGVWSFTHGAVTGSEEYSINISSTGYVTVKINGIQKQAYQGTVSDYKLVVTAGSSSMLISNIRLINAANPEKTFCFDRDTDGDGIPNRLDLDSDGDGCSDAFEAGTTTDRTQNFTYPNSGVGTNGFANVLETSVDNGIYSGTYKALNVIDKFTKSCLDTDGDNVIDLIDLDDDNDGVLDSEECQAPVFDNWIDLANFKSKLMSSAFHGTLFRSAKGNYYVAGQYAKPDGTDQTTPTLVTPANGYNYSGEIIDIAAAGDNSCYAIATTKGIWVWGYLSTNFILPGTSSTGASPFQQVTLPSEIDPKNIKSISASTNNFIILLQDGTVYSYGSANASINGAGLSTSYKGFTKVLVSANTPLANISQIEATSGGSFAADVTNKKLYTWGTNVYLGNGTAMATKNYATEMTNPLPNGTGIAMIDATYSTSMTYLLLGSDRKVYAMGSGAAGILGQNNTTNSTSWLNVKGKDGVGDLQNVEYLSAQNSTDGYTSASVILTNGQPLSWGDAGGNYMIGLGNSSTLVPKTPDGITDADFIYVIENGGHLTPMLNDKGEIGNVGHNVAGAFADGSSSSRSVYVFNTFERGSDFSDNIASSCNPDIDGDGIPNRLDLDTDGDGCSDAKESGVKGTLLSGSLQNKVNGSLTATTVNNAIAQGTYGNNGFANSLETSSESGTYSGTYYYDFATDPNVSACTDIDNDGVADILDLDDDNDGVLDIKEQSCTQTNMSKANITVSSTVNWYFQNAPTGLNALVDGSLIQQVYPTDVSLNNKTILQFNLPTPKLLTLIELANNPNQIPFIARGTYKIQGSNDGGTTWIDIVASQVVANTLPIWATTNSIKFDMPQNVYPYLSYRIYGISISGQANWAQEAYFGELVCTDLDTDNDGIPNRLDLDSDGDGCPDAVETGATYISTTGISGAARLTTSIIPSSPNYGANGFANGLETATESGIYTGTYTYYYATDNKINACLDTDTDGVPDVMDLDDDNDGVLDSQECEINTFYFAKSFTLANGVVTGTINNVPFTYTSTSPIVLTGAFTDYDKFPSNYGVPLTNPSIQNTAYDRNTITFGTPVSNPIFVFSSVGNASTTVPVIFSQPVELEWYYKDNPSWITSVVDANTIKANEGYWIVRVPGVHSSLTFTYTIGETYSNFNFGYKKTEYCDTDGDGIINKLDLDSDGDGCPDAVEAGTTAVLTSGVASSAKLTTSVIPAPYGANGFANGLETASESGAYSGTYTYSFVTDATVNGCRDTDGDGVPDVLDLDDDNDGILDTIEDNCSVIVVNKTGAIITKPSTINYTFNGNTIANLIDGVDNNVYVINGPSGTLNGPWLNFEFPSPKALTYLEIGHYPGQLLFSTTSTYKIQGSSDNTNWTDVSEILTYNNVATSTSGGLSTTISNIANFSSNKKAYKYYRILGINATVGAGWATEIYFKEFVCATADLDGDGIPNRLDLDSDGDGCPDAVEAGTTAIPTSGVASAAKLTTSVISAPYGANGFANGLETASESGAYTGTYTYNFAVDATLNACTDTDGDGVPDVIDLDDDNDGVLDTNEQTNCVTYGIDLNTLTFNGTSISAKTINSITSAGGDVWKSSYSDQNLKLPISLKFKHNSTTGYEMFGLIPAATTQTPTSYGDGGYKFYPQTTNVYGYFTTAWDFNQAISPTDVLSIDISSTGYVTAAINGVTKKAFQGLVSDYKLDLSSYRASSISDIILTEATHPAQFSCTDLDTDNDGIPNRLDLDSDGDGCPDAKEAGVNGTLSSGSVKNGTGGAVTSTTTVANAIAAGPYGNNGLANGVETSTESGVVTYTSTYANIALVKDLVAPTITTQPLNRTVFVGATAVLTTTAGTPPANRTLTYQWYKAGVAIAGANSATYTITSSATASNADNYYCALGFVNSCLTTNTNTVNLTVLTNPVGLTACQDASAVLSVTKTGTNSVTYQWKKATTNLVNGSNIAGVTNSSLTLTNLSLADAGAYTLVATDANGVVITSLAGTITITNNTKYVLPTSYATCATTSTINLASAVLTGTSGATSTKWQRSLDGGNTWSDIVSSMDGVTYTNFTTATLGITAANTTASSSLNGYQYRIASLNASCTNYSNVETITINTAPTITSQPSNSVLCNVFGTSFTAAATGASLTYKWQTRAPAGTWTTITALNANTIDAGVVYSNFATATLNLSAAPSTENNNEYQVVFTNSCGTVTSTTAILNPTVATPTITGGNISVCEGTPITLTTSSTTSSPTYQWYLAGTAIGGATGTTYNPTVSGNYSVIANATGYCKSGTASSTVTINPLPSVSIAQGAVLTLASGGSIQLTATASPSGTYSYTWYNAGTLVSGPSTSNSYPVSAIGSYTVKATNSTTTCFANSSSTIISILPTASATGSTTICSGGSVELTFALSAGQTIQWESSVDGSIWTSTGATSATYNATPTNSTNSPISIYYHAVISGASPTGTTNAIVVTVNPLPTATISNTASGTTLCARTNAILTASSAAASATYQWYNNNTIITGAIASTYSTTGSGIFSFKVTDGSTSCAANSISSTVTVVSPPAAPNLTATSKIICVNTTADLTVYQPLAIAGVSYEWHSASNTISSTLVADPTKVGTAGTYYLFAKNNTAGCFGNASVPFTLSIVSVTQATLTGASSPTYTIGDIAVGLNASTSNPTYSLRWYAAATGGVALTAPVIPSTATAGITNYYVEQYDANASFCTSNPRQLAAVTVKPLAPIVTGITYCQNATAVALTATPAIGGTLNWYGTAATGGTLTATATIPGTGTVTNTSYYVSQTVNGVEGARAALTVTINAAPSAPSVISGTFSVTSTNSYTYSVTAVANTTYQWTLPSFMSGKSTTSSISALVNAAGSGTINVIAINANGCLSPATTSSVISAAQYVTPPPATTNITYTIGDPAIPANTASRVTAATDAILNYYTSNAAGSTSTIAQSIPTTAGVYTYYVSQTINGIESVLVPYTVTIKPLQPIVADITYCQNDIALALTATGTDLQWYTVSTGGTATTTAPTPSTGTATNTTYYVTQTVNAVESDRIALLVNINPTPATPSSITGSNTTSTQSSEVYTVTNDANATGYAWVLPNGWTGTSSINSITVTVGLSGGQIKVKALSGSCASPFSTLSVDILNVTNPPLTTDITFITGSIPSNIATNTTALITGTASTTLNFYTSNAAGNASSSTQTTPTTPGVYTYYVSQTSSIGVESILVPYTITIKPIAPPINTNNGIIGNAITYCKGASAFALTATASTGGTLKWYTVATGGASSNNAPTPSTSLVGTTNYYVSQVVNGVESDRVLIVVTVNDAPAAVTATATQPTCTNSSGYIVITSPLGTGFTYSVDGSNYTNTTLFSALPAGIYFATAKNNVGCISAPTPITINTAVAPPLSPLVTVTQPTCAFTTGSITILSTTLSTDNFSIDGGLNYQASKIFTGVAPGTYTVTTLNAGGCISTGTAAIVNAALPIPAKPIISSSSASANICAGNTVTLTSSALIGNQWYKNGVLIAGAINQSYVPNASGNYTVVATNASGCTSLPSEAQSITFNPLPTPIISNGATLAFDNCATTVITLTASNTNTSTGNTYQWYLNGNSINVGGTNSTYNANQAGSYSVVITNNGCSATSPISKLIAAPSVNAANTAFCAGGSSLISGISTGFTSPTYQWKVSTNDGLSFGNASGTGTNLTYTATTAGKYQLEVTDGGIVSTSCPINVTVFTNPTATITASPSASVCVGSTISLNANASSGTASYTYQWLIAGGNDIAEAALSSYSAGVTGSYAVKVTDANGCVVNAAPSTISYNAIPTAPLVTITNPTCDIATGTISVTSPLGAGYTYSIDGTNYTNTTGLFTGVTPGLTYNVTMKSSTGCTSIATVASIAATLVVPAQPVITGPANIIPFSLNTYSVAPVTGATSYSWNIPGYWSGVSTTNTITIKVDASAGSFSVTANSASCVSIAATKNITATILNPDVNVTDINVPVSGKLTTNDIIPAGTTYGQPGTNAANPTGATITVNADGSYTFTATTPGKYIYYVPVCAAGQTTGCPVSPLEITVLDPLAVTDKPVANNDIANAKPGVPTTVNILANDAAGNSGGTLNTSSVSISSAPKHGLVVVNSDGTITYTAAAGFVGTDSVLYNVCDNSLPTPLCQTAVVYFTVVPSSAPSVTTAVDDYATVLASTGGTNTVSGNVLTNDKNTAGASLTANLITGPTSAQGSFTMNANGSYTFTPTAGFSGPVDITYTACTGATPAACATATIHILVEAPSVINPDIATAYINILTTGDISTNDVLLAGTTYGQPAQQAGATITVNPNGTYSFTATEPGTYTYTIPVCAPGQTSNCPNQTLVITVPVSTLVNDAATAYVNIPQPGSIATNNTVPAGTTYGTPVADPSNPALGTGAASSGAVLTMTANGTYTFTASVAGTYTYTVPVCAPGQTIDCPTETIVFTVPVNTLVDDAANALINVPTSGSIATNDVVPAGSNYGTPVADPTNPAAGSGAASSGSVLTMTANGTYTFTATVAGTYTYTVPVCAPSQTTNCPTTTIVFTVPVNTLVNDAATAYVNIPQPGSIATNDVVPTGTTYGNPVADPSNPALGTGAASSGAVLTMTANGTYTFTATVAGTYTYTIPVCAPGQSTNCPTTTIVFTVIGNNPQGTINLKYNTLLASDSVHVKLKVYDGVGPYTMIFKNSINSRIDTVKNISDSATIMLPSFNNDVVFTITKIIDYNNSTRLAKFDKDTARLTILRPKILLTLKADLPSKLPDNSFKTKIVLKIKNNGGLYLQNVQVEADLSKVFPPDMQFLLDSVKVTSGNLALNPTYTGFGAAKAPSYTAKVVNGFSVKYRTLSTLSGSELFNNGVNLDINEEGSVVFYLTLKPGVNIEPLVLQFTSAGDGLLVQKDGNRSMQPTTSISHDNSNINAHPLVTTIGSPLPTYIPFYLINEIGASLEASQPDTVNGGYVFHFKSNIKNYSNSNLDSVAASFDINQFIKAPDSSRIYGTPTVIGTTTFNTNYDGKNDIQLFTGVSQLKVGDSIKVAFDLFVKTDKTKAIWPTYLIAKGITTTGDLKVTDTSTNGSNPDPNGNKIPNESVRTIIGIGLVPPPAPQVISAVYEVDDKRNPKNIGQLIKKISVGTVPTWCNVDGTACSINPPILPNMVGTYIWCVKSFDTITGLSSTPCVYDTVRIIPINKYSKYDLIKSAKTIEYDLSGKFIIGFNIKVVNNTDRQIDSILIQDDLTKTFKRSDGYKLLSISSSGTLLANNAFDGISNIELLKPASYLAANSSDSILIKILIESESIDGDFNNAANMKIWSDYGKLDLLSNDTVVNKNGLTSRLATKFKVPKIELNIPEGFSPNNDGIDDTWFIKYPFGMKLDVKVVNRWGNEVYANSDYKNDWRGKGIKNFLGEDLPEGTYYYIVHTIDRNGTSNKFAGPLTIIR